MFIQNLNTKQQELLLDASYKLIAVDGVFDEREIQMINILISQCEDNVQKKKSEQLENKKEFQLTEIKKNFINNKEKVSFMLELIAITLADEDYAEEEKRFLKEIAEEMEISDSFLKEMETWVQNQINLTKQATSFMNY